MYRKRWLNETDCIIEQLSANGFWRKSSSKSLGYLRWIDSNNIVEEISYYKPEIVEEEILEEVVEETEKVAVEEETAVEEAAVEEAAYENVINEELTLEELKELKKQEIAANRYEEEISGIVIDKKNNTIFSTTKDSLIKLTGITLQVMQNPSYECNWKTSSGWIKMNSSLIIAISQMVRQHIQKCFDKEKVLFEEIEIASSKEEIEAITW